MKKRSLLLITVILVISLSTAALAQIYPPKPGVKYPDAYLERIRQDKTAFRFQKAWIQKTERARRNRQQLRMENLTQGDIRQLLMSRPMETAVTGTAQVPVFMTKFSNTASDPYPVSDLQTELFDGPWPTGSMADYYSEISYGNMTLDGTVYDWFTLAEPDTYYSGTTNGLGVDSKVGQLILETLNEWDPTIDFGAYDNDGPDGVPNSGDDDGYVDFVSFVHPEIGAECGNDNIWSHRWVVTGWPEFSAPYSTNDARYGGGVIRIYDYTIQPALSCGGSMIEIGVYCHEFGHAFGLPDYYDTNGGSAGIGHWGLMGSGSWNEEWSPSHMCAWAKIQLGWIIPVEVGPEPAVYSIDNVEFNAEAYKLNVMEEKWRRLPGCAIAGSYSMHCGLTTAEATARSWPGGEGYGDRWDETVSREFGYNGSDPVTLTYDYHHDSEPNYDYTYVYINVNDIDYNIATYDDVGSGTEVISLTSYLSGSGATSYEIKFRFVSDYAWSDGDGDYNSTCGPFTFDNVSVSGGGESYAADFESYEDGWHVDMSDPAEFFIVENRQALGFDQYVHGGGGLCIWHVDTGIGNNTGGDSDDQPHRLDLEQADGLDHLGSNTNRGDGGDPYPGTSSNTSFDAVSTPDSYSNNNNMTNVAVTGIGSSGDPMSATMKGGWSPPALISVFPDSAYTDGGPVYIAELLGTGFNYGASFHLTNGADPDIDATGVEWVGHAKVAGWLDVTGAEPGLYDVVVENPDGQTAVIIEGFEVIDTTTTDSNVPDVPVEYALGQNHPNPFNPSTVIPFDIPEPRMVTLKVYDVSGRLVRTLVNDFMPASHYDVRWDGKNDRGMNVSSGVYFYQLQAGDSFSDVRKLILMR